MLVSSTVYYSSVIALIAILIVAGYYFSKKQKNKIFQITSSVLGIGLFVFGKMIFPNVYTVESCRVVKKEIMLMPYSTKNGLAIEYGKHCYLLNQSKQSIHIETAFYGDYTPEKYPLENIEEDLAPQIEKRYAFVSINNFFEPLPTTVRTKAGGEIMHLVDCGE